MVESKIESKVGISGYPTGQDVTQPAGEEGGGERKVRWNSSCAPQGIPWAFCPQWTAWVTTSSSGLHQGQTEPPWPDPR